MIPGSANSLLLTSAAGPAPGPTVDNIEHSVRLNSADSAQFTKTFSSAGNTTTNTISLWLKRNKISYALSSLQSFLSANNDFIWTFDTSDRLCLYQGAGFIRITTQKFRDPSAWYHFVFATDTTQSAASDQIKVYVNGQLITAWDTEAALTQNTVLNWNSNVQHCIGSNNSIQFPDIQIADVQNIDGLQLTPSSFGFTDSNGVWQPKAYTGDYGTEDYPGATTDSSGSFFSGRGPENLFDGSTGTLCDPALQSGVITFTPTTGIPYSSSVEVYVAAGVDISLNGGAAVTSSTSGWTIVDSGSGTISSLAVTISGFRPNWRAIRVDGKILVNSPNGFHLDFADTSSATALGNDVSGNNNDWTVNNISVTAGSGNDSLVDSPTNYGTDTGAGGEVRGNYCTLNPLDKATNGGSTNGNFEYLSSGGRPNAINGTMAVSSGKWYYESIATNNAYSGGGNPVYQAGFVSLDIWDGVFANPMCRTAGSGFYGYSYREGNKSVNGTYTSFATGAAISDVIGLALDLDAGELEIYKNGTSLGVLATGLSGTFTPCVESDTNSTGQAATVNFGQQPFKYPQSGYKSLCSTNLPTPAIADGSTAMDVKLYTGNGSTQTISGLGFSPDLVWIKNRAQTDNHKLLDTVRGATEELESNTTGAEATNADGLTAFNSDGFALGADVEYNTSSEAYVAWTWDAGSSTVSNTDGSITSQVRANPTAGISIVTVNSTTTGTIGHGLGVKPDMIIEKCLGATSNWYIRHQALGNMAAAYLRFTSIAAGSDTTAWSNTEPTSTTISINNNYLYANGSVAYYCFAPVEGFSSFGSFTGSTSNTFVYTGMRPRWLMIKRTDTTGNWQILDTEREGYNVDNDPLWANLGDQEGTTDIADILSNGFKMRDGATGDYIYAAFAEHPFNTSRAR